MFYLGVMTHAHNSSTWDVEAGRSSVQDYTPQLYIEFEARFELPDARHQTTTTPKSLKRVKDIAVKY